ncbi:MAG TPA: tetratricopeptide repeat protein [Phycisphaerae bacterium]|nr:tetratricopeptide repeat protein [Phycisphaerae bacterium]
MLGFGSSARSGEPSPRSLVVEAVQAFNAGDNTKALKLLEDAEKLRPESPEIAYNRGVVHYRAGDYAKAADFFTRTLASRDRSLEQRSSFNLGNCAYAEALKQQDQPAAAIEKLRAAADRYRQALSLDPSDADARANLERAGRLIGLLREQQEQQKQQSSQPSPQDQSTSQPESRPESQPASQQAGRQDQDDQSKQEQDRQQAGRKDENQKQGDRQAADRQDGEENNKDEQQARAVPATQRAMSKEEAERLLQLIRDKERQRREALYEQEQRLRSQQAPVDKDW